MVAQRHGEMGSTIAEAGIGIWKKSGDPAI